jgi:hypothetical protein
MKKRAAHFTMLLLDKGAVVHTERDKFYTKRYISAAGDQRVKEERRIKNSDKITN